VAVVVDTDGAELGRMLMFEVDDGGAAIEFAERALGPELGTAEVDGITLITDDAGRAAAIRAGFLLIGPESLVRRSVELSSDDSLAADQVAQQALGKLPAERLAEAYLSAPLAAALAGGDELAPLDAFVNSGASQGAAAALVVEEDAIGVAIRSVLDPERSESDPGTFAGLSRFEPTLTSRVAGDALVRPRRCDRARRVRRPDTIQQAPREAGRRRSGARPAAASAGRGCADGRARRASRGRRRRRRRGARGGRPDRGPLPGAPCEGR
jgi:hypothetical protein